MHIAIIRGGVEDIRLEAKAKDPPKKTRPKSRPRTALPRTDLLEAKDRTARGQGQGPRTQAACVLQKKEKKRSSKIFFQAICKTLTIQKVVLSSSQGQGNFRGLEALTPRPRTSKCVLKDSTSGNYSSSLGSIKILTNAEQIYSK